MLSFCCVIISMGMNYIKLKILPSRMEGPHCSTLTHNETGISEYRCTLHSYLRSYWKNPKDGPEHYFLLLSQPIPPLKDKFPPFLNPTLCWSTLDYLQISTILPGSYFELIKQNELESLVAIPCCLLFTFIPPWSWMSIRKSFILKFNYLYHPRGGVQNPDNKTNTQRLKKLIFAWCFTSLCKVTSSTGFWISLQFAGQGERSAWRYQLDKLEDILAILDSILQTVVSSSCLFIYLFCFLGSHLRHMEIPRLGVQSELQLLAYASAIATQDPSHVFNLHHSSQQCQILNPLSTARDRTGNLMVPSRIR